MEDNSKNYNKFLRNDFELIHKNYCKNFKNFLKEFDNIFSTNTASASASAMTKEEYEKFIPCIENYAKIMNIARLDLDEFMEDVNKSATNGPENYLVDDSLLKLMMLSYILN